MNPAARRIQTISYLHRPLTKHITQNLNPRILSIQTPLPSTPRSTHSQPQPQPLNLASPISTLLANGATWDTLTTSFPNINLTPTLIDTILLNLKEPNTAKKALLFFHWSSRRSTHNLRSYCIITHILVRAALLTDSRALLESAIKNTNNIAQNPSLAETLLSTFEITHSSPRALDFLIQTYSKMRMVEVAFSACNYFGGHGFPPSLISFNSMLHSAMKSGLYALAWKVYEHMLVKRVYPNQTSIQIMVDLMCKEGTLRRIVNVLDRINEKRCAPTVIVSTAVALRIIEDDRVEEGILLLKRMLMKNLVLDVVVYSLIVFAHCRRGDLELAGKVFDEMLGRGCSSNAFVCTAFARAHCEAGRMEEAVGMVREMQAVGLKPYDEMYNFLIEGCSRMGRVEESLLLYEEMMKEGFVPDCVACNAMMGSLCEAGGVERANDILTVLLEKGFAPNLATYLELIDGFGRIGKSEGVLKLYYEMEHKGLNICSEVYASLIENLRRCGKLKEAQKFATIMTQNFGSKGE